MAAGSTYTPIVTTTLGVASGTVTLSSIPSTYTDLILVVSGRGQSNTGWGLKFNNDTGSNYSSTYLDGNGTSVTSEQYSTPGFMRTVWNAYWNSSNACNSIVNILNYSNTTTYKSSLWRNNSSTYEESGAGLWRSTGAINRIDIITSSADFTSGTTFTLYGIAAA